MNTPRSDASEARWPVESEPHPRVKLTRSTLCPRVAPPLVRDTGSPHMKAIRHDVDSRMSTILAGIRARGSSGGLADTTTYPTDRGLGTLLAPLAEAHAEGIFVSFTQRAAETFRCRARLVA